MSIFLVVAVEGVYTSLRQPVTTQQLAEAGASEERKMTSTPTIAPRTNRSADEHRELDARDEALIAESGVAEDVARVVALGRECIKVGEEECGSDYSLQDGDWTYIAEKMGRKLTTWERAALVRLA